ncbi:MAG: hypothetical protein K2X87_28890 [Gemmataceae bacterium]|nr:hypothetical protein [Gemmataceae bacterium]
MTSSRRRGLVERLVGAGLAAALLGSAVAHLGHPYYYLSSVYNYRIVGERVGLWAAAATPGVHAAVGVCLLAGWWARGAYLAALVLFAAYLAAQWSAPHRGLDITCGCFGSGEGLPVGPATLAVAGGCAVGSLAGFVLARRPSPAEEAARCVEADRGSR